MSGIVNAYPRDGTALVGDDTGRERLHVYVGQDRILASPDPGALLDRVCEAGLPLSVSPEAISALLTLGVIPMPGSIFREVRILGIGDRWRSGEHGAADQHAVAFPFFQAASRQDEQPDAARLLDRLTQSVATALEGGRSASVMLSSGKDSTAIAVCLARLGRGDVRCLTFTAGTEQDEDHYAAGLCKRLGLPHARVELPADRPVESDRLTAFFRNAPMPCADDCQIPYWMALQQAGGCEVVLDGSGNDVYFGHVPSRNDRRRAMLRVRPASLARRLVPWAPFATRCAQLCRHPLEHCFVQGLLRPHEVQRVFPAFAGVEHDVQRVWESVRGHDVFDTRAFVRGRDYDQGSCAMKAQMACAAAGMVCALPWTGRNVVEYCFHLPERARFDRRCCVNKILLRELLHREIAYPDQSLGKRYFQFNRIAFFSSNRQRVYAEILGCRYWACGASERLLAAMYARLPGNARVGVALNAWFLLSGWLNHNRWLTP